MQLTARFNRSFTLADRSEKGDLLGTNAKPINGIFYVAVFDHTAVITSRSCPHKKGRIGAMGTVGGLTSPSQLSLSVSRQEPWAARDPEMTGETIKEKRGETALLSPRWHLNTDPTNQPFPYVRPST